MTVPLSGVLVVDKPSGPTSFDVVRRVRGLLKVKKAGHTGTLDPIATGVLPVCLGDATKIQGFITEADKEYEACIRLGVATDTQDAAGKVTSERPVPVLSREQLQDALADFTGEIEQLPPMHSARKIAGKRLYELARRGEEIEREPRRVTIDELDLVAWEPPLATVHVRCSRGTYVRTLANDLGEKLGCGGHLKWLRRTRTGPFTLDEAIPLDTLMALAKSGRQGEIAERLVSMREALATMAQLELRAPHVRMVTHGQPLQIPELKDLGAPPYPRGRRVRLVSPEGLLIAVAESDGEGTLKLLRVLAEAGED